MISRGNVGLTAPKQGNRFVARAALAANFFAMFSLLLSPVASASMNSLNAGSLDTTKIKASPPACKDICDMLIGTGGSSTGDIKSDNGDNGINNSNNKNANGATGANDYTNYSTFGGSAGTSTTPAVPGKPWDGKADQWCTDHGLPTVTGLAPSPGATPTGVPTSNPDGTTTTTANTGNCNIPLTPSDGNDCTGANTKALQCMLHGSQLESQCMAYEAAQGVQAMEWVLLALDIASTAVCTTACLASLSVVGAEAAPALEKACEGVGALTTVTELIDNIATQQSPVGHALNGALEALGAAGATVGIVTTATHAGTLSTGAKIAACGSAVVFAIMTGVRVASIVGDANTQSDACNAVTGLWSSSTAQGTGGGGTGSTNPAQFLFNPATGQLTQGGPGGAAGGGTGSVTGSTAAGVTCAGVTCPPPAATAGGLVNAATDSGLLNKSGLADALTPVLPQIEAGLGDAIKQGAGAALGNAMSGSGDLGAALANLAQQAQEHPGDVPGMSGMGTFSGGGGGAGASAQKADNPFGSLFGGGAKATARAPSSEQFGKAAKMDIWHTGTTQNIFEIISDKVSKVASRVGPR